MDSQDKTLQEGTVEEVKAAEQAAEVENKVETPATVEEETPAAIEEAAAVTVDSGSAAVEEAPAVEEEIPEMPENPELTEAPEAERKVYTSKQEILERMKEIAHGDENPQKAEIDYLKTAFYKLHFAEREAQQKAYLDAGGDPEKYVVAPDEDETAFKAEMVVIKEKRQKLFMQQEEEKQENLKKKLDIIEKLKTLATSPEEANKTYQEFKKLQQSWREIKAVPAEKANELWRNYQL